MLSNTKGKHIFNPFQNFFSFTSYSQYQTLNAFKIPREKNNFNLKCYISQSYQLNESQIKDFPVMGELRTPSSSCKLFAGDYMTVHFIQREY